MLLSACRPCRHLSTAGSAFEVKNFPSDWDDEQIVSKFGAYGPIASHCVRKDPKGRPFAFVAFETPEAAKKAVEERDLGAT